MTNPASATSFFRAHSGSIIRNIRDLVCIETPTGTTDAITRALQLIANQLEGITSISMVPTPAGPILHATRSGRSAQRIVMLGHVDTVHPVGSWDELWREEGERLYGPGIYDMKAGIVHAVWALKALEHFHAPHDCAIELVVTPDEETGSHESRGYIERVAQGAQAILVVEPAHSGGELKVARKGLGDLAVTVYGRAAHQGSEPEQGRNAIVSAAEIILELEKLQDLERGATVGTNVISGGTTSNVVADRVSLEVDIRVWSLDEYRRIEQALGRIKTREGTSCEMTCVLNRPPMEPSEVSLRLLVLAQETARTIGFEVGSARVGGGSDANFTSVFAPTLDGFGAVGGGAHQRNAEYVLTTCVSERIGLLYGMLIGIQGR